MAEGKTNLFGKTYNTIGSTDSNFIIKTKGDLKIQWGNKFIDLIKNGKIVSENSEILFLVESPDEIQKNGVYIVTAEENNELWVCIDGVKVQINNTTGENVYVSFMMEQKTTSDQQHQAHTNIGFYYETLQKAKSAKINSGIIYVEEDNKLYIAKNGNLIQYILSASQEETITENNTREPLYIEGYSLYADGTEYIQCSGEIIKLLQPVIVYNGIQSNNANPEFGFRLFINQDKAILDVDIVNWRDYPNPIKYSELLALINSKTLNPKMYYLLTDFQNPWEVTWEDEPFYYEDQYEEINSVEHLKGKRNATKLIIRALNNDTIEKQVWTPMYPDWVIHYDPFFKGPEHKVMEEGKEITYYGFRTRDFEQTLEDGSIKKTTTYLPCKGQITYLKDEFGNEGNFNFRQFMFKQGTNWRYIMDSETKEVLGKFFEGTNNKFFIDSLESFVQVFTFEEIKDASGVVTGYNMITKDSNVQISKGHSLFIQATIIEGNTFQLSKTEETVNHIIQKNIKNNSFINQNKLIKINIDCEGNTFENFTNPINISGKEFNNNYLANFTGNINNSEYFNDNAINKCDGLITNNNNFIKNTINEIKSDVINNYIFSENIINSINNITINGQVSNNYLEDIEECVLKSFIGNSAYKRLYRLIVQTSMTNCVFREDISSLTVTNVFDSQFDFIDNLTLDNDVYFTTFHGRIGNIVKQLTEFEKEWLKDASKKTDAYPNIRVVCIPEIIIKGMIIMWYGQEPIPKGWALCDGNNGTPNLINKFIKSSDGFIVGGTSVGDNSDTIEPSLTEDNKLKLTVEHLPTHRHPHLPHSHKAGNATSNYVESYSYSYTDSTGEDTETEYDTSYYNTDIDHTHTIYEETSKEDESITFDNKLFSIEPRAYKLIFIMKIDEDTISYS